MLRRHFILLLTLAGKQPVSRPLGMLLAEGSLQVPVISTHYFRGFAWMHIKQYITMGLCGNGAAHIMVVKKQVGVALELPLCCSRIYPQWPYSFL